MIDIKASAILDSRTKATNAMHGIFEKRKSGELPRQHLSKFIWFDGNCLFFWE
jgi:hypothetical protein